MTRAEFVEIAEALQLYFPRETLFPNPRALDLWFRELDDFTAEAVEQALRHWVRKERRGPTIADLRQLAQEYNNRAALDLDDLQNQRRSLEDLRRRVNAGRTEVEK